MLQLLAVLLTLAALWLPVSFLLAGLLDRAGRGRLALAGDLGAVDLFIPKIWAAQLLTKLSKLYVLADPGTSVNTDYEGEIRQGGDTVHIGSLSDPTVSDYVKNVTAISPQTLSTTDQVLVIDQSKYFAFEVDDVDRAQVQNAGALLTTAAQRAAERMREIADAYLGTIMTANAGTVLPPAAITTPDEAYRALVRLALALNRKDVPAEGRWVAIGPDFQALLQLDPRFNDASRAGSTETLRNGIVGRVLGMDVKVSTALPVGTAPAAGAVSGFIIAGHRMATTWAEQINKVEAYRPQDSFSDAVKGLHLYGAKVIRPEALAVQDIDVTV